MVKQLLQGLLLLAIGIGVIGFGVVGPFATYQAVQNHETTEVEIRSTGIESAEEVDEGETEVEFYPRIEYTYTVDGTSYTDSRIYHPSQVENEPGELEGKEFDQRGNAEAVVDDYSRGATATLYYDPADPAFSYLRDPSGGLLQSVAIIGVMGLLFGGIGLGAALGLVSLND